MPVKLVPKRKLGLLYTDDGADTTIQNISNVTIQEIKAGPTISLDFIADGGTYERVLGTELSGGIYKSASDTASGIIEIATTAETTTGTDATRAVSPDGLAGSIFGKRVIEFALNGATALTTSDKAYARIPAIFNGWDLVAVAAMCVGASSSGAITLTVKNGSTSMLTTNITIDVSEYDTITAATPAVIDTANDGVATGAQIEVAVSGAGTGVTYLITELTFQLP